MTELFLKILNMSLKASWVILAVLIIRFLLKKAPKKYSYALWAASAFRLVCPVSFKSVISLFALRFERRNTVHLDLTQVASPVVNVINPQANIGVPAVDTAINSSLPAPTPQYSANPMQIIMYIAALVWLIGIAVMVVYGVVTYIRLNRKLRFAVKFEDNVFETDIIASPFIMGMIRPKIYIPKGLDTDKLSYVLQHERAHLKRFDHVVKPLAFLILAMHWFNPLVWLGFYLMSRDMEMSCDETVLSKEDSSNTDYSTTLLSLAVKGRFPAPSPLAFGESGVKKRIKNALKFKKPAVWISIIAVVICIAVIFVCAADPKEKEPQASDILSQAYAAPETIYMNGSFSYIPVTDDTASYYIDHNGTVLTKGWTAEEGWREMGTLQSVYLTKENFDDYFVENDMHWEDGYSVQELREENLNAWQFEYSGNLYYILQQEDDELFYVVISKNAGTDSISVIGEGVSDEFIVRWIFKLEPAGMQGVSYTISGDSYVSYQCLYMSPLSSFAAIGGDSSYRYVIVEHGNAIGDNEVIPRSRPFVMINRHNGDIKTIGEFGEWQEFPYTKEEWNDLFLTGDVDISGYETKQWMPFEGRNGYALAKMDDQLWFVDINKESDGKEFAWCIYSLVPESYMGNMAWEYSEGEALEIEFSVPGNMTAVCTQTGISTDGENFDTEAAWSDGKLWWSPLDENGEPVLRAQIQFTSDKGFGGVVYIDGFYQGKDLWYTLTTSGTALHLKGKDMDTALIHVVDFLEVPETETTPSRDPVDFTVDNTGEDFFRYEDIADRTIGMYHDRREQKANELNFRVPSAVSQCSPVVVVGEVVDRYYADGESIHTLQEAVTVYDFKIEQALRGDYVAGDLISVSYDGGYYRWYVQQPEILEWAAEGSIKYAGIPDVGIVTNYGGIPEMQVGERYVMFLHTAEKGGYVEGSLVNVGAWTGVYKISDDGMVFRNVDAETVWEYGTLEELIQEVKENPFDEYKYYDRYIDIPYTD